MALVIVRGGASGFAQDVVVDQRHRLAADEPEAAGGTDTGPSPYDYLLVALGA
jgi:putative redox protein